MVTFGTTARHTDSNMSHKVYFPHLRVPLPAFLEIDANASAEQIEQPLIRYKGMIVMLSGIHTSHSLAVIPVTSLRPVITIFIALIIFVIFSFLNFEKIIFIRIVKLTRKKFRQKAEAILAPPIHILIRLLCIDLTMGRWDAGTGIRFPNIRRNYLRIIKYVIFAGFIIVAVVVLSVFIPRSGLNVEIIERSEVMGTMQTVSVKISNNNFDSLSNVEEQFGD
jgi:hypothetical protein